MKNTTARQIVACESLQDTAEQCYTVLIASRGVISHFIFENGAHITIEHDCNDPLDSCSKLRDSAIENKI